MSSPDPTSNPRKPRLRISVDFEPLKERLQIVSWIERIRRDRSTGGLGIVVSLVIHVVLMVALAFVLFKVRESGDGDPLIASWMTASEQAAAQGRKIKPISIPIDVGRNPTTTSTPSSTKNPTDSGEERNGGPKPGVAPVDVRQSLENRNPRTRAANLDRLGGSKDAERAITQGLLWLSRQQKSDGRWELHQGYPDHGFATIRTDTGATALALLAFLGHGNTHQDGEHADVVAKGIKWLRTIQDPNTGDLHDMRQEEGRQGAFYAHAMATIALCETLALTQDNDLKPSAELAVKYLLAAQHPENGGWKYRPISKLMVGDTSVTGWALMALHTARMAGIEVQHEDFVRASSFLDSVQVPGMSRYKYEPTTPDAKASPGLTAEALLCRQWLGWPKNTPQMSQGVKYVTDAEQSPSWSGGRRNVYAWYYTSQMLHNIGGDDWKRWNSAVRDAVIKNQVTGGTAKQGQDVRGSWNPTSPPGDPFEHSERGGRLYMTTLCILILETPYRHQSIYAADEVAKAEKSE